MRDKLKHIRTVVTAQKFFAFLKGPVLLYSDVRYTILKIELWAMKNSNKSVSVVWLTSTIKHLIRLSKKSRKPVNIYDIPYFKQVLVCAIKYMSLS